MQKFSVTPIGTCRINNPLRQAQSRFPIVVNASKIYGFTHTSSEGLQQIQFLQGDKSFPESVLPILFRPELPRAAQSETWQRSDLHIVEISSAKKISSGDIPVQINYLYRYFSEFFSSPKRTQRFWSLVKRDGRAELAEFLRADPAFRLLSPGDRELLTSLRMEEQDFASIKTDMAEIAERLGRDALVFMTHVNARTPDGSTIPARERLINWVKLAAGQLQVPCFDPTPAMEAFGQERALEHGGLDLTHFTQGFSDRVYAEIHREHVGRLMEARPELMDGQDGALRQHLLADNIEALIKFDDFMAGSRRLYAALRKEPDAGPLIQLRGKTLSQIGDFEGAIRDLEGLDRCSVLSAEGRIALLEAYTGTEQWARALEIAEQLLGDEHETGTIHACAAAAYEHSGQPERALDSWKQAFRQDRSNLRAALKTLTMLSRQGEVDQFQAWREEVLEHSGSGVSGAFEIARWALEHRDEALFGKVFGAICAVDVGRAEALFDSLFSSSMFDAAAACLRQLAACSASPAPSSARIATRSAKVAADLLEEGRFRVAQELAAAASMIRPGGLATRTARSALAHFRQAVREAHSRQDYPAVTAVWQEAGDVILAAPDAALLVALSFYKLGDSQAALELLLKINGEESRTPAALRWTGRIAAGLGRYEVALPMYSALRSSALPGAEKFRDETARFFETADRRACKQLRAAVIAGEFALAMDLADLLRPEMADGDALNGEVDRLNRRLRLQLREIENGTADEEDRSEILALLLRINADDTAILRRSAIEAMRRMRFGQAAELWSRLNQLAPGVETNARNLERCQVLAARQHKSSSTGRKTEPVG